MTTAIRDNLTITLDEAKAWLRVDDDLEATLIEPSAASSLTHKVSDLSGLRSGRWVTVAGVDAKITYVDYPESTIVVDRVVSLSPLVEQTTVSWSDKNGIIMDALEMSKTAADQYLGNPFLKVRIINGVSVPYVEIPPEVKVWVLRHTAYLYAAPEVGIKSDSARESGSTSFDNRFETLMEPIRHYRRIPI